MVWYSIFIYIFELFKLWGYTIFVSPFINLNMLWILVPVWFSWFFAEFFQEKEGTSMGNAISNATIIIWAAIDCTRQTVSLIGGGIITTTWEIIFRFSLLAAILGYGIMLVVLGWKGNTLIKKIGRIREVTYIFAIFVPIFYNYTPLTSNHILAALLFFPLFYYAIELIDKILPDPKAVTMDLEDTSSSKKPESPSDEPQRPSPSTPAAQPGQPPGQQPQNQPPRHPIYRPINRYPPRKTSYWDFKM